MFIYYNDGKKRTQLTCKVCKAKFQIHKRHRRKQKPSSDLYCPYCQRKLYNWKEQDHITIYKCGNKQCPCRLDNLKKLNLSEKMIQKMAPTHFKLNYQYREYHFTPEQLRHSKPANSKVNLFKIHLSEFQLGLILSFHISFGLSARKTAFICNQLYDMRISDQTVRNYAQAAAAYCHEFNLKHKGPIDDIISGDETYIKVLGKHHYVWFIVSAEKRSIIAYHVADNRRTQPAIVAMSEAIRTADPDQKVTIITDGNPSYPSGLHYINQDRDKDKKIKHIKVIGLENLDEDSTLYRAYKQIIERLNRTYKQHARPFAGFNSFNGAVTLTTLFVTHYNFLRPHMALKYKMPIEIPQLRGIKTLPNKWIRILAMVA